MYPNPTELLDALIVPVTKTAHPASTRALPAKARP